MSTLKIEVHKVKGKCPVYKTGSTFYILDGYKLSFDPPKSSKRSQRSKRTARFICLHSLASIMPYYVALSRGISPKSLGISKPNQPNTAYVHCLDPCEYTRGGTVIFKITEINKCTKR